MDIRKPEQVNNATASAHGGAPIRTLSPPSAQERFRSYAAGLGAARIRLWLSAFLTLVSLLFALYAAVPQPPFALPPAAEKIAACVLPLLTAALGYEAVLRAWQELRRVRVGLSALVLLVTALSVYDALRFGSSAWPLACLLLLGLQRAALSERVGYAATLHTFLSMDAPQGVALQKRPEGALPVARSVAGDREDFLAHLEQPDATRRARELLTSALFLFALLLSYLLAPMAQRGFAQTLLLLLLSALPLCAGLSFSRPFGTLARRLAGRAALCGYHAARVLGGQYTIVLRDEDLFPAGSIRPNGMKLYSPLAPARVISYALAALRAASSPLALLFDEMLAAQFGKRCTATSYRLHGDGGIEAEVAGETVLVGSLSFMHSLGVRMPKGAALRQAVYVAVGGELAGIFALKYRADGAVREALRALLAQPKLDLVLMTRDFLITPELLAAKFRLPTQRLRFPPYGKRRARLRIDEETAPAQGALIAPGDFPAFCAAVCAAKSMKTAAFVNFALSLAAGLIGLAVCAMSFVWNAPLSPLILTAYHLIWGVLAELSAWLSLRP